MSRLVVLSNRGPLSWSRGPDGTLESRRGAGGLVSALTPALEASGGTWIAAAMSDADRQAPPTPGVELLPVDPTAFAAYRETVADGFLWFAHHDLWDRARTPVIDAAAHDAWDAYVEVNRTFADAALATAGDVVAVQDYHLSLVPAMLKAARPDLPVVHFSHTPFAPVTALSVLPQRWCEELVRGLAAADLCGFHTPRWARRFSDAVVRWGGGLMARTGAFPLGPDAAALVRDAAAPAVDAELAALDAVLDGRRCVIRVDRAELSKNVLRGLLAFDALLTRRPELAATTAHVVLLNPSRGYDAYVRYLDECLALVDAINARHRATAGRDAVVCFAEDRFARSLAAYRRADVVVVNAISDGLNLVAKESALVNEHDSVLVLSTETGAHAELADACIAVDPYDVDATSHAIENALELDPATKRSQAALLRQLAATNPPGDWLAAQLAAIGA